jgi:hypothetical protein
MYQLNGDILNFDHCDLEKYVKLKNPGIMYCIRTRCIYD